MKKDYLKRLDEELSKVNAKHKDEIIEKYKKRYDFGLESGLKDDEIEQMLGDPEEVAKKYKGEDPFTNDGYNKNYNMKVKTVSDDIVIKRTNDSKVHIFFDDCNPDMYNVKNNSDGIIIDYPKTKYFSFNRKKGGIITIEIPSERKFFEASIQSASGDIKIDYLNAKKMEIAIASGDVVIHKIEGESIRLNTVSGEIFIDKANASKQITVASVSGDIEANYIDSKLLIVDTVSGDATIKENTGGLKTSSVSGEVYVNGIECGNIKNYWKGMFKK